MKHRVKGKKLNRDSQSRRALFKNLLRSLIEHYAIQTTLPKAKAIQGQFDTMVVKAKRGTLADLRELDKVLNDRRFVNILVKVIAPATKNRPSGFTRITRLKHHLGDNATIVRLSLIDLQEKPIEKIQAVTAKPVAKSALKTTPKTAIPSKIQTPVAAAPSAPVTVRKTP